MQNDSRRNVVMCTANKTFKTEDQHSLGWGKTSRFSAPHNRVKVMVTSNINMDMKIANGWRNYQDHCRPTGARTGQMATKNGPAISSIMYTDEAGVWQ